MSQARDLGDAANKVNYLDNVTSDIQSQLTPAGTIITFGGTTAPTGYLPCEGGIYLKSMYPDLWAAIGETWGTATITQFYVPDLRGAFLRGTGSHGTHNMANGNDFAGQAVGSFETDQFQEHSHNIVYRNDSGGTEHSPYTSIDGSNYGSCASEYYLNHSYGQSNRQGENCHLRNKITAKTTGGDETRPFNASILYCIKT